MKLHLISDVHMEFTSPEKVPFPAVEGDVCILAGDVGSVNHITAYVDYIKRLKQNFTHVVLIKGNHELYRSTYSDGLVLMDYIAELSGAHFLDSSWKKDSVTLDGVVFWGSTLWTDMKRGDSLVQNRVADALNDYVLIRQFSTSESIQIHNDTVARINWDADVIVTHHMPILRQHSKFPIDHITYGFNCTDLESLIAQSKVKYWLYGHTHDNTTTVVGNTKIVTNQCGYPREKMTSNYNPYMLLEL